MLTSVSTEVFGEGIRDMVTGIKDTFTDPNDDWHSMLFFEDAEGEPTLAALPGELFATDRTKDMLVRALAVILRESKAVRYALLLNAWMIRAPYTKDESETSEQAKERLMAEHSEWTGHYDQHPDRQEVLTLLVADRTNSEMWMAEIKRSEDAPPTLADWELAKESEGRFASLATVLQDGDEA